MALFVTIGGCQKELGPNDPIHFTVYGAVYNYAGEPVNGAKITLEGATAGSTMSGIDGQFRIPCITTRNIILTSGHHVYHLKAICAGYNDYFESFTIAETEGAEIKMDILLERIAGGINSPIYPY